MTNPITPPSELVEQWEAETAHTTKDEIWHVAVQAARWGADQELEACCKWLPKLPPWSGNDLRKHRRPKPPSLKEQAIAALSEMSIEPCLINDVDVNAAVCAKYNTIRRALEALPDNTSLPS
jgi:hypothetical protein